MKTFLQQKEIVYLLIYVCSHARARVLGLLRISADSPGEGRGGEMEENGKKRRKCRKRKEEEGKKGLWGKSDERGAALWQGVRKGTEVTFCWSNYIIRHQRQPEKPPLEVSSATLAAFSTSDRKMTYMNMILEFNCVKMNSNSAPHTLGHRSFRSTQSRHTHTHTQTHTLTRRSRPITLML